MRPSLAPVRHFASSNLVTSVSGGGASGESQHQPGLLPIRLAVSHGPWLCLHASEKLLQSGIAEWMQH